MTAMWVLQIALFLKIPVLPELKVLEVLSQDCAIYYRRKI